MKPLVATPSPKTLRSTRKGGNNESDWTTINMEYYIWTSLRSRWKCKAVNNGLSECNTCGRDRSMEGTNIDTCGAKNMDKLWVVFLNSLALWYEKQCADVSWQMTSGFAKCHSVLSLPGWLSSGWQCRARECLPKFQLQSGDYTFINYTGTN